MVLYRTGTQVYCPARRCCASSGRVAQRNHRPVPVGGPPRSALYRQHKIALGRVAIVQADDRYCNSNPSPSSIDYWQSSARITAHWAAQHNYFHFVYCVTDCAHEVRCTVAVPLFCTLGIASRHALPSSQVFGARHPAWCKLLALAHTLEVGSFQTVLYLDSDAYWVNINRTLEWLVRRYVKPSDWHNASIHFGCNGHWTKHWDFRSPNAQLGAANTGAMLLRRSPTTLAVLRAWWGRPHGHSEKWAWFWGSRADHHYVQRYKAFAFHGNWEQSILWRLWRTSPRLAANLRILADASSTCMWTVPGQPSSPIVHICGPNITRAARDAALAAAAAAQGHAHNRYLTPLVLNASHPDTARLLRHTTQT